MKTLEFRLEFGSTHVHLSVARIGAQAARQGVPVIGRPFCLKPCSSSQA